MKRLVGLVALLLAAIGTSMAAAAERSTATVTPVAARDVLAAEAAGLITLKYIPNDSRSAQVVVENKSDQPLTLRLPDAFAGVPVLAQFGMGGIGGGMGGGGFGGGGGGGGGMGGGQAMGGGGMGGMGGMGGGMGGMGGGMGGMGGGMFSVPPEKTKVVKVATVCLEYGKDEPSPRLPYRLVRLDSFSEDPALAAIMVALGRGEISQKVAQAAAWHLASGRSWQQLAAEKIDRAGGAPDLQYFSLAELLAARQVVAIAVERTGRGAAGSGPVSRQFRSPGEG